MLARDLVDATREDIQVKYKGQKQRPIGKDAWQSLQETLKSLEMAAIPEPYDESEDEEAILLLL